MSGKSKLAAALGIFMVVFCLVTCGTQPAAIPFTATRTGSKSVRTYVVCHGWHTGLIIPAAILNRRIPALRERFGTPAYYEIGWGDVGFYRAKTVTIGLSIRAMCCSSGTVIHLSTIGDSPFQAFPHSEISTLMLTPEQCDNMGRFITSSFARDAGGEVVPLGKGIYGESQFYLGTGHYSAINTCNKWTAKGLLSAGVKISPWSKLTSRSVMRALADSPSPTPTSP